MKGAHRNLAGTLGERRGIRLPPVAVQQVPEPAEERALLAPPAARLGRRRVDTAREAAERKRLKPDSTGPLERREEESLAAEERGLHLAHELDVVLDARLERHEAAGVDAKHLAR